VTAKVTAAAKPKKAPAPAKAKSTTTKAKTATKKTTTKAKSAKPAAKHAVPDAHQLHLAHLAHLKAIGKAGFAVGDLLPVCSAQALAQSLRLAGERVSDDEVLELHYRAGGTDGEPVSIGEALAAAALFGLAGCRLVAADLVEDLESALCGAGSFENVLRRPAMLFDPPGDLFASDFHGLILRIDVPGPHAVLATADGWWSWGELYSPWRCNVSAAWAVSWEAGRDLNPAASPSRSLGSALTMPVGSELPASPLILGAAA
jgi:hypothetical protein